MSDTILYIIFAVLVVITFAVAYYYGRDEKPKL